MASKEYVIVSSNPAHGEVYSIQNYVIKFLSDLRQVGGFLWVLQFTPPINLTATLKLKTTPPLPSPIPIWHTPDTHLNLILRESYAFDDSRTNSERPFRTVPVKKLSIDSGNVVLLLTNCFGIFTLGVFICVYNSTY